MMRHRHLATVALAALTLISCSSKEKFPPLGDNVSSPIDVAVSDDGQKFFVLNADFDRTYNQGSVLVLDKNGEKLGTAELPRMGRRMVVAGNDMLVATDFTDYSDKNAKPRLILFDVSTPETPVAKASFDLDCSPFNIVLRKGYPHFAVSCIDGELLIGTLASDRSASTLKTVRSYGTSRRALYLDTKRELILGFVADTTQKKLNDGEYKDATRFDGSAQEVKGPNGELVPNDVPDLMEDRARAQANRLQRLPFQYFVYDLARERTNAPGCTKSETESCDFPLRSNFDPEVTKELRWAYFKLAGKDGTPDASEFASDATYKYYRTNFWEAKPDPGSEDVFYLSQRAASDKSPFSNNIVKVTIKGELRSGDKDPPLTQDVLSFERVYGFKDSESKPNHFPSDFVVTDIQGQKTLVLNHIKDLTAWNKNEQYFSIAAKSLSGQNAGWSTEAEGSNSVSHLLTYYQVAAMPDGRIASCSFYGNEVVLLQLKLGVGLEEVARVR